MANTVNLVPVAHDPFSPDYQTSAGVLGGVLNNVLSQPTAGYNHVAAWMDAHRAMTAQRTPARVAAYKIATRNMANKLGLDPVRVANATNQQIAQAMPSR